MKTATTSIILHTNVVHKSGEYPIKLRVTYLRKSKYYHINNLSYSEKDFERIMGEKPREEFKKIKVELYNKENEAIKIIENLPYFTFDLFEKQFLYGKKISNTNIFNWIENTISKLNDQERVKTAKLYNSSMASLKKFTGKKELLFYDISVDFLNEYEKWFTEKEGHSITTLGIYLRNVRAVFNEAIEKGAIIREAYPFGRRRYEISTGQNIKKALTLAEIHKIYTYPSIEDSPEERWKAMWVFSYLCNGVNVKDMCLLKYKNIHDGKITFIRAKTKRTKRKDANPVVVIISKEIQAIIDKWGNPYNKEDDYVFPILSKGLDVYKIAATIDQTTQNINKYIDRIAKAVKINKKVTTYTARHSFATVLKRSGVSTEFISESIGHADLKTTQNYLDSFEDEAKMEYAKNLLNFDSLVKKEDSQ